MSLSKQEVQHIANLARLELSDEEVALYQQQLSHILEHVGALQALNTEDVAPTSGLRVENSRLREDVAGEAMAREDLLANAPETQDNQFLVPPVLD